MRLLFLLGSVVLVLPLRAAEPPSAPATVYVSKGGAYDPPAPYMQPGGIVASLDGRVRDGVLWLLSTEGRICRIRAGDGRPLARKSGPQSYRPSGGPMCWAVSPDGSSLWLAGHWNVRATQSEGNIPFNDGIVYRVNPATGRGLVHPKALANLTCLDLSEARATSAGLKHLETLTKLKLVSVTNTQVGGRRKSGGQCRVE